MAHDENNGRDLDAPTPPGGPLRQDAPDADVNPGPQKHPQGTDPNAQPSVQPSGSPDGPQVVPAPPTPEGEPVPDREQGENAATSLDQPSDNAGAE
ncbi:MAG: hypothetical protein ACXWDI_06895 [Nocardioides sp.]